MKYQRKCSETSMKQKRQTNLHTHYISFKLVSQIKALVYLKSDMSEPLGSITLAERAKRLRNGLVNRLLLKGWDGSRFRLGEGVSPTELAVLKNSATETT